MESNNTFEGGQVSDLSKLIQNKNTALQVLNFRPLTELGQSNGALVNIKGNQCAIKFPELRKVFRFKLNKDTSGSSVFTLTINGQTTSNITINASTTTSDVVDAIKFLANCYDSTNPIPSPTPNFAVASDEDFIVIYQAPEYKNCTAVSDNVTVTVNTISLTGTNYFIFITSTSAEVNNPAIPPYYINSNNSGLYIIGSTYIGEYYYLFTVPISSAANTGQIWEMYYDEVNKQTNVKLLYNAYLGFSTSFPIAPSAAIGRYELPELQRIYWTDFNNPVRTVNVKDPDLMVLSVDLVNLKPNVKFNVPTLTRVNDTGSVAGLNAGSVFQCAYRLVKNNGAVTNYSNPSNLYYCTEYSISNQSNPYDYFSAMEGAVTNNTVDKTLEWTVSNIDTNFDSIEFVIIERRNTGAITINKFDTQIINGNDTITTTFVSDPDEEEEITLSEFLLDTIFFSHCKTLEQKDNRLFYANVRSELEEAIDNFDTRAYRFLPSSDNILVKAFDTDTLATQYTIINTSDYDNIPLNRDNIPLYNLGFDSTDNALYNGNTKYLRNSTEIGGEGPNIKFRFGTVLLETDQNSTQPQSGLSNSGSDRDNATNTGMLYKYGYRIPGGLMVANNVLPIIVNPTNLNTLYQSYPQYNTKQTLGGDYFAGLFKSYQHNEIYRFGIVFYDKYGQQSFVKWIADIKFPNYDDPTVNGGWATVNGSPPFQATDFRSCYWDVNSGAYVNMPYIDFEVNIPGNIADLISCYEIVRCKREEKDRSVAGHGLMTQVSTGAGPFNNDYFLPIPNQVYTGGSNILNPRTYPSGLPNSPCEGAYNAFAFHCFNYLIDPVKGQFTSGDKFYATERYEYVVNSAVTPATFVAGPNMYYIQKYYRLLQNFALGTTASRFFVSDVQYVTTGGTSAFINGGTGVYYNYNLDVSNWPTINYNRSQSLGCATHIFGIDATANPINWGAGGLNADMTSGTNCKILGIHVKPSKLTTQYGGRTYVKRASSEYITAQAYQTVESAGASRVKVFGGDIYHGVLDIQKAIKNWNQTGRAVSGDGVKCSQTFFFPTQSPDNIDLRNGKHINADLTNDSGASGATLTDEYSYYPSYSFENDIKKFYPKPLFFNQTDQWNNRVYYSEVKINGETADSWTNILTNNYYDVEGNYGGINALVRLHDDMYYLQDSAFGQLLINPVSLVSDSNNLPIKLGDGSVIQKHRHISIDAGSKHQWSVARSQSALTFVDIRKRKAYLFNGQSLDPISDTRGNRNYFIKKLNPTNIITNDNPILNKGIITTYDFYHDEFLYTTLDTHQEANGENEILIEDHDTIAYSMLTGKFTGQYSFAPNIYVNNNSRLYSQKNTFTASNRLYQHNVGIYGNFYGVQYKSSIKSILNDNPLRTKVYDNLSWNTESIEDDTVRLDDYINTDPTKISDNINYLNDTFKRLRCYNEYQNSDWSNLLITNPITNLRKSEQGYNTIVPRNKVNYDTTPINTKSIFDPTVLTKTSFGERMRDKYLIVDLEYDNALNNRFIVHNLQSTYRISDR